MSPLKLLGRVAAVAMAVALGSIPAWADPLGLAEPMRNPGAIFDNVVRDQGSDLGMPAHLRRQVVAWSGSEAAGTIVIDTPHTYLYYVLGGGRAIRYGIGVGREGFTWAGVESIARKAEWPDWIHAQRGRDGPLRAGACRDQGRSAAEFARPRHRAHGAGRLCVFAAALAGAAACRAISLREFGQHSAPVRTLLSPPRLRAGDRVDS